MTKPFFALLALVALAAPVSLGCANAVDSEVVAGETQDLTSADRELEQELEAALAGLETGGGEGDPDPYRVFGVALGSDEEMTDEVLLERLLPKLFSDAPVGDMIPGLEEQSAAKAWARNVADPDPADWEGDDEGLELAKEAAAKWRAVKAIFDAKLMNVKYFDMGYRSAPGGSLETGEVAHVFVGVSATGRIVAISGIDIWT